MPRLARVLVPGAPHHVTQRGNNRQDAFFADEDRRAYLHVLAEQAERFDLQVLGYCLMTNHVHLIVVPEAGGIADQSSGAHALALHAGGELTAWA